MYIFIDLGRPARTVSTQLQTLSWPLWSPTFGRSSDPNRVSEGHDCRSTCIALGIVAAACAQNLRCVPLNAQAWYSRYRYSVSYTFVYNFVDFTEADPFNSNFRRFRRKDVKKIPAEDRKPRFFLLFFAIIRHPGSALILTATRLLWKKNSWASRVLWAWHTATWLVMNPLY